MSLAKLIPTFLFCLLLAVPSFADDKLKSIADELAPRGITYEYNDRTLEITIDENKAKATIPYLQSQGVLPKNITASEIEAMPVTAAVEAVGMSFTVVLIHNLFRENLKLDKIHVAAYLMPGDAGIFTRKKPCYSFDFDRDTYNKINWQTVTTKDFMWQTTNFALEKWCREKIIAETKRR